MHTITSCHLWSFGIIWAPREPKFDFNWSRESDGEAASCLAPASLVYFMTQPPVPLVTCLDGS